MCSPLSHDSEAVGGGAVDGGGLAAPVGCGRTFVTELVMLVTELVTLRPLAGWPQLSPARLLAAASVIINVAAAKVFQVLPVPPNISRHQPSNPIASPPPKLLPVVP